MLIALTGGPPNIAGRMRRTRTFQALGRFSAELGQDLLVTTPANWSIRKERVRGWKYDLQGGTEVWRSITVPMQDSVVYDAMYLADLKQYQADYRTWKRFIDKGSIPFFNPILPAKDLIYRSLERTELWPGRIPATEYNVDTVRVVKLVKERQHVWLKPTIGSGGRNMVLLQYLGQDRFKVVAERFYGRSLHKEVTSKELRRLLFYATERRKYMAQEHIPLLHTRDGRKFDLRVTVQRDGTGVWQVVALTGRFGSPGSTLTNFHAGGRVESFSHPTPRQMVQLNEFGVTEANLSQAAKLALLVAAQLQQQYERLGILGLDIGQSERGGLFVYDFNGRPGRDILTDPEVSHAMRCIAGYSGYLRNPGTAPVVL